MLVFAVVATLRSGRKVNLAVLRRTTDRDHLARHHRAPAARGAPRHHQEPDAGVRGGGDARARARRDGRVSPPEPAAVDRRPGRGRAARCERRRSLGHRSMAERSAARPARGGDRGCGGGEPRPNAGQLVLDARGRFVTSSGGRMSGVQFSQDRLTTLRTSDALVGDAYWDARLGKATLALAVPIRQADGRYVGALMAKLTLRS